MLKTEIVGESEFEVLYLSYILVSQLWFYIIEDNKEGELELHYSNHKFCFIFIFILQNLHLHLVILV